MYVAILHGKIQNKEAFLKGLAQLAEKYGLEAAALSGEAIKSALHVKSALYHACRSFLHRKNIAASLSMEVMLYAAGKRQISEAIDKVGIKEGDNSVVIACLGKKKACFMFVKEVAKRFGLRAQQPLLQDRDLQSIENTAMLDVYK